VCHFFCLGRSRPGRLADPQVAACVQPTSSTRYERGGDALPASYGLEIFDVQYRARASGMVLRVQIDRPDRARRPRTA
jgi:hypothetical protein